jgi:hypothetical protein
MPLDKSPTPAAVHSNIKELMASGYPQKQAVAIALSTAREGRRKRRRKAK